MQVNVNQAVKVFFPKSSFEMVYFEAVANALDAAATEISIELMNTDTTSNLLLTISDNGVGFTDDRFEKFGKLLDVEEQTHKGLGRLVYLCYFKKVSVESVYENSLKRSFEFSNDFNGECEIEEAQDQSNYAKIKMYGFLGEKIHKKEFIDPIYVKEILLEHFYIQLYRAKLDGRHIKINITANQSGGRRLQVIDTTDLPDFTIKNIDQKRNLFDQLQLYYYFKKVDIGRGKIITALGVDNRTQRVDIISPDNFPNDYEIVFLLISNSFSIDTSRQSLTISDKDFIEIRTLFKNEIAKVINEKFPHIYQSNCEKIKYLADTFPHLVGYIDNGDVGFYAQGEVIAKAQDKFFKDQKEILGASTLTDEQYEKSLQLSSRLLAEYILFRHKLIDRLKAISKNELEEDIHNLIAPKFNVFREDNFIENLFRNNAWVFDDKFMTYRSVLSEQEITDVINELTNGEANEKDDDRPDIVLFFSSDPKQKDTKFDVVIVELKRLGLSPERNSDVEIQLEKRASRLSKYYNNQIQRIWYYGIVDIDKDYLHHLRNAQFKPLYSKGTAYYKQKEIYVDADSEDSVLANTYILDFKSLVYNAEDRNHTFLQILKQDFQSDNNE